MRGRIHPKRSVKGFTLLELMMVVVIIAILASIALPNFLRASERARSSEAIQTLGTIRASVLRFRAQHPTGANPASVNVLDIGLPVSTNWNYATILTDLAALDDLRAVRTGGVNNGAVVKMDVATGVSCGVAPNPFGLGVEIATAGTNCI